MRREGKLVRRKIPAITQLECAGRCAASCPDEELFLHPSEVPLVPPSGRWGCGSGSRRPCCCRSHHTDLSLPSPWSALPQRHV